MSANGPHHDWLAFIEISGPFLAVPVLKEAFPQGLEELDGLKRKRLRQAYEEWRDALETDDPQFPELHTAWIDEVLSRGLEFDEDGKGDVLKRVDWCVANLNVGLPEHGVAVSPDLAVVDEQRANKPLILIQTYGQDVDLDANLKRDGWAATPADRMVQLCRAAGCRLGLVTNGERWMLVDAPVGAVTTFASWYARIWGQEPITLQAFVHLLGIRRFFVDKAEQLPALFDRSLKYQDEVTDALGEQVRRAVEVLIQALDKADQDRDRELLRDVKESVLYEAALTVMMRLVFLLSAEERGLLLLGDERYEANYALSTLRMQLRKESEEILERRWDAWSRLLAIFRAVFGGIEHENLRLPALGGSLFDPDRFPFLEGRAKSSNWRTDAAKPLPIDNRSVLLLLEAIQQFQGRTLSYRALDVEQIGYVYEGLLERTVKRTVEVTLELDGTKSAKSPWVKLAELESARLDGTDHLAELLQERSGSSASRVRNELAKPVDGMLADRLLAACSGDVGLRDRIKPYANLVRVDYRSYPLVYPAGAFIVTTGSDRRESGTHYTPKSLTEAIVTETLTPIVYAGPAEGAPRERWLLKLPAELLDLKICDPAMGSGAFLVQACRWLADRLVEAWVQAEAAGKTVGVDGEVLDVGGTKELLPGDIEARTVTARRLIAERCLYGVDLNPLAVELAKLSIWLVTLSKDRPFGFLDHNLRCGDSLLGIHRLDQLTQLTMSPTGQGQLRLFGQNVERAVCEAIELRIRLREMPIRDIRDVEAMALLDADARRRLEVSECIADALFGEVFASGGNGVALENTLAKLAIQAGQVIDGDRDVLVLMRRRSTVALSNDLPADKPARRPFHWPLAFPEVFNSPDGGFHAVIGNPPFLGGRRITYRHSEALLHHLKSWLHGAAGTTDLCVYFLLRAAVVTGRSGFIGLVLSDIISQGESRVNGLDRLLSEGSSVYKCVPSMDWPGQAGVKIALVCISKATWNAPVTIGEVTFDGTVNSYLQISDSGQEFTPLKLMQNDELCFSGHYLMGQGFVLSSVERDRILGANKNNEEVIYPYIRGDDINNEPSQSSGTYAINFSMRELAKCEDRYPECLRVIRELVKPERDIVKRKANRERWWRYAEARPGLEGKLSRLDRVIVQPFTAKYIFPTFVPARSVFAHPLVVIVRPSFDVYGCLQSSIHEKWVWQNCSTSLDLLRYTATTVLSTFPFPIESEDIGSVAKGYYEFRQFLIERYEIGLTKIYNKFHDIDNTSSDIVELRELHRQLDISVAGAYGWQDVSLDHAFHETKQGVRFTISEPARIEVLRRLSELNRRRYEGEVTRGLHTDAAPRASSRALRDGRAAKATSVQSLLDFEAGATTTNSSAPATPVLGFLRAHEGWHAKSDILTATGISGGQWNAAIADLIGAGKIERRGEGRGAHYRVLTGEEK
ncbi:ATP phosphoribosyltransferase regulatory subunit [Rhodanobacter sp. FW510-R12]|uniref:Eco57I restriction-modification methylase domain-containing protein n=1 Tax=Rhodanobacter TaxID=75309 RepID=UPI0003F5A8D6|nr:MULTISPECIES: DNA methyltransferase [Rhodanobacter]TAN14591.1 MAG: SAM-dependent DNA methyltransferase [Rhodanobacter sp.]UJJ55197.1 SAM-dependent DNA methyltransferase [Rhodanobacter thiooxydans]